MVRLVFPTVLFWFVGSCGLGDVFERLLGRFGGHVWEVLRGIASAFWRAFRRLLEGFQKEGFYEAFGRL